VCLAVVHGRPFQLDTGVLKWFEKFKQKVERGGHGSLLCDKLHIFLNRSHTLASKILLNVCQYVYRYRPTRFL